MPSFKAAVSCVVIFMSVLALPWLGDPQHDLTSVDESGEAQAPNVVPPMISPGVYLDPALTVYKVSDV
jgi:hypothetical protein